MATHPLLTTFIFAIFFGVVLTIIANRLNIPAIIFLLIGGVFLGPSFIGINIINPEHLGDGLSVIIKLAIALILFEGGLTLDKKGYKAVSGEIRNALTFGVLITWLLTAAVIKVLFQYDIPFSMLCGSLIIVTGPTVIVPLLKRINVTKNIKNFLHWEGVIIDPIGVFIALLTYEWMIGHNAIMFFFLRIATGISVGIASGLLLSYIIKKEWLVEEYLNIMILSSALIIYLLSDLIIAESGLMSVIISGFVIGYSDTPQIDNIKIYKAQLIDLLIGLLFILLAANVDIGVFKKYYSLNLLLVIIAVMLLIRPVNIIFSTIGNKFSIREKLFLGWVAPRGIVAASMASLFALNLKEYDFAQYATNAEFLEVFTYSIICGTVIIQGFTAKPIGKLLRVVEPLNGWLIVGIHNLSLAVSQFIKDNGFSLVFIDTNIQAINTARDMGFTALNANAVTIKPDDYPELYGIGNVLAITVNRNLNELVCQRWKKILHNPALYQWRFIERSELQNREISLTGKPVWTDLHLDLIIKMPLKNINFPIFLREDIRKEPIKNPEYVLMFINNKKITPYVNENTEGACSCIVYDPIDVTLDLNIKPNWILVSEATELSKVYEELLTSFKRDYPNIDIEAINHSIVTQQQECSNVVESMVSLTHAYVDGIDGSVVLVARVKEAVSCVFNNQKAIFIFLVLSPRNKPDVHIDTLAKISKLVTEKAYRKTMFKAKSREDLIRFFFPNIL